MLLGKKLAGSMVSPLTTQSQTLQIIYVHTSLQTERCERFKLAARHIPGVAIVKTGPVMPLQH